MLASLRRARALALGGAVALSVAVASPAQADTADAEAKAKEILAKVQALQVKVKQAETAYDRTLAGVAASVNASIQTDRTHEQLAAEAAAASDALDDRVRGLYMSGGPLALYATVLSSGSITDFQDRVVLVNSVVDADRLVLHADEALAEQAGELSRQAAHAAQRSIKTERNVRVVADRVARLLAEQQQLLDEANARVAELQALDAARAALAAQARAFDSITASRLATLHVLPPSPLYMSLYHQAALSCPGLSWTVLAAIGQVESGHGRNPSTSSAGAMGPMQFLPSTFAHYGVDGNHDGVLDIMDPYDAIFSAANYLCANGAGRGGDALYSAIWHYNHADWYVQMVLTLARQYAA